MVGLNGLSAINIELTSRCNKSCSMCGHQDQTINHSLEYGDMDFGLLQRIYYQLPSNILVQFHRDGEPLLYPQLKEALKLFRTNITSIVTNGKLLVDRAEDIIGLSDNVCVSFFRGDLDQEEQIDILKQFMLRKGGMRPQVTVKLVGDMDACGIESIPGVRVIRRLLHIPEMSRDYRKGSPTIPEHGICLDFLNHPSVNWKGELFICQRLDPDKKGLLGDLKKDRLASLWNSKMRLNWFDAHVSGHRNKVPLCTGCQYWGVPSGCD